MISPELRARIRRLFFAEHWKMGTIAAELGVHRRHGRACGLRCHHAACVAFRAYLRESFFAARVFRSFEELNGPLDEWIERVADARLVPLGRDRIATPPCA